MAGLLNARRHSAWIYDQGGETRLFEIKNCAEISYERVRDDQSTARVTVAAVERDRQLDQLGQIEPGRHELHIFREDKLAWCGPVNLPETSNEFDLFEMSAKDVTFYWDRTAIENVYSNAYPNNDYTVNRIEKIARSELARKEGWWKLLNHLHFYVQSGDARTSAKNARMSLTLFDHIDDFASRGGIDYTVVGREQHFWDTSRAAMGTGPTITRADFLAEPKAKKYGSELATRVVATDGQGGYGVAGGTDAYYGEWDIVVQAYDAETDTVKPTAAELRSQASLSLKGRNPTPLQLTVPAGSSINPSSPLYDLDLLIPGIHLPLDLTIGTRTVQRTQKLQNVTVTENSKGETISVSLYPAAGFGASDEDQVV